MLRRSFPRCYFTPSSSPSSSTILRFHQQQKLHQGRIPIIIPEKIMKHHHVEAVTFLYPPLPTSAMRFISSNMSTISKEEVQLSDHHTVSSDTRKAKDDNNILSKQSSSIEDTSSSSLSLLQTYTSRGKTRPHPLDLLASFAEKEIIKPQNSSSSLSTTSSSWSIEEIQIITADAARRIAKANRNVAASDDDKDAGVNNNNHQEEDNISSSILSFDNETLLDSILGSDTNVLADRHVLAEEQHKFDEMHSKLFTSGLIEDWVDNWEKEFQQENKIKKKNKTTTSTQNHQNENESSSVSSVSAEMKPTEDILSSPELLDSMMNNLDPSPIINELKTEEKQQVATTSPTIVTSANNDSSSAVINNSRNDFVETSSQLSSIVILVQRHILLSSLLHRYDAAVQAFMILAQIRQNIKIVRDDSSSGSNKRILGGDRISSRSPHHHHHQSSVVDTEVLTWRNLRDVVAACSKEGQYESAETLVRFVIKKIVDAANSDHEMENHEKKNTTTMMRVWPGIHPKTSRLPVSFHLESMIPSQVMTSLSKCIKSAKDLQRFRELMAIEATTTTTTIGALSHIPVSSELYTELILACSRCTDEPRRTEFALSFHRAISDNGLEQTPETYASLMAVFAADSNSPTEAFALFHEAKAQCSPVAVAACPSLYNRLIESYANSGKLHDAIATTNVLMENGAPLTRRGFHSAMMSCAVQGDYGQAQSFLKIMQGGAQGKNVRTTIGAGEREGLMRASNDLYYSAMNPSSFYSISPTPTSLAIQLASLFFIKKAKEMTWREKLTVVGDLTHDAFSLLPFKEDSNNNSINNETDDGINNKNNNTGASFQRISIFCENEPFFCAILEKVLCESIVSPSLFESYLPTKKVDPKKTQLIMTTKKNTSFENDEEQLQQKNLLEIKQRRAGKDESSAIIKGTEEKLLYRRHINLPIRILQSHVQHSLSLLLERSLNRIQASLEEKLQNDDTDEERAQREFEMLETIISRAQALFAPQRPTKMPKFASVAALMPDVILNPTASMFSSSSSPSSTSMPAAASNQQSASSTSSGSKSYLFSDTPKNSSNNIDEQQQHQLETDEANTLVHLLQTILPQTTFFILPFSSLRSIVAEFDALQTMNDFPLFQRELFEKQLRRSTSYLVAENDERTKISNIEAKMQKAVDGRNGKVTWNDLSAFVHHSSQSEANNLISSSWSAEEKKLMKDEEIDEIAAEGDSSQYNNPTTSSASAATTSSLTNPQMIVDERRSLTFHEKEHRLDKLADAVLALAVFLHHHGDKVHVGSATEEIDLSRAASALHLSYSDPVQRAAASSIALVYSPMSMKIIGNNDVVSGDSSSKITDDSDDSDRGLFDVVQLAKSHSYEARRAAITSSHNSNKNSNNSKLTPTARKFIDEHQKTESNLRTLYFDSRVNLNLVTCDSILARKFYVNNNKKTNYNNNNNNVNPFASAIKDIQRLARKVSAVEDESFNRAMFLSEEEEEEMLFGKKSIIGNSRDSSNTNSSHSKRLNSTGIKFSFGSKTSASQSKASSNISPSSSSRLIAERRKELGIKSFEVRVADPTRMMI